MRYEEFVVAEGQKRMGEAYKGYTSLVWEREWCFPMKLTVKHSKSKMDFLFKCMFFAKQSWMEHKELTYIFRNTQTSFSIYNMCKEGGFQFKRRTNN